MFIVIQFNGYIYLWIYIYIIYLGNGITDPFLGSIFLFWADHQSPSKASSGSNSTRSHKSSAATASPEPLFRSGNDIRFMDVYGIYVQCVLYIYDHYSKLCVYIYVYTCTYIFDVVYKPTISIASIVTAEFGLWDWWFDH